MQESRESRIEQKIEDIYSFVESCKMQRLSATRVIVPKDELYDLLDDLRRDIPAEIKRYRKILNQRDAILDDANTKAQAMLADGIAEAISRMTDNDMQAIAMLTAFIEETERRCKKKMLERLTNGN